MTTEFLEINGATGGGQILRAALAMSTASGIAFRMRHIRGKREKPGLKRQHLMCIKACAEICDATVSGAELDSTELTFVPRAVKAGDYRFDIASGGSTVLLMQAVAPALARVLKEGEQASVTVTGGAYCPFAPTFEFMNETLAPCMKSMGYAVSFSMPHAAFYQAGGGEVRLDAAGVFQPKPFAMTEKGKRLRTDVRILNCHLAEAIAQREKNLLIEEFGIPLGITENRIVVSSDAEISEAGNALMIRVACESGISVFSEVGRPRLSAESVARIAARNAAAFTASTVPICRHLQDQLLVPMALAKGGHFLTSSPSPHTRSCAQVIEAFTGKRVEMEQTDKGWEITIPALDEGI
ncbi:MAG: RNA 3'-terminal phosphate cyclase [Sutterellaceae bacterium]|nr:RNA 3'-terminal phosphate cyclase [Sutterellaceae bacterium]